MVLSIIYQQRHNKKIAKNDWLSPAQLIQSAFSLSIPSFLEGWTELLFLHSSWKGEDVKQMFSKPGTVKSVTAVVTECDDLQGE
jgi:hypothetical protein